MKKNRLKYLSMLMVLALMLGLLPTCATAASAASGNWQDSGIPDIGWYVQALNADPATTTFTISNAAELAGLASLVTISNVLYDNEYKVVSSGGTSVPGMFFSGKTIKLAGDIDLAEREWTPIGVSHDMFGQRSYPPFEGTFDGQGHKITGLTIGTSTTPMVSYKYASLFGLTHNAVITDTGVDVSIYAGACEEGDIHAAGLVGYATGGTISYCYSTGVIRIIGTVGWDDAGGLVAYSDSATITHSYSECNVTASGIDEIIGGFVGFNTGSLKYDYASGTVTSSTTDCAESDKGAGGFAGKNFGKILNCYATGNVSASSSSSIFFAGGFTGVNDSSGIIGNCYQAGTTSFTTISANNGAFMGKNSGTLINCYYDSSLNTLGESNARGLTTEAMQGSTGLDLSYYTSYTDSTTKVLATSNAGVFFDALNGCTDISGEDLTSAWTAVSGSYPKLIIPVTGVRLVSAPVYTGEQATFTAYTSPGIATNNTLTWSSSNESAATVSGSMVSGVNTGTVSGISAGTTEIRATAADGIQYASCTVTVSSGYAVAIGSEAPGGAGYTRDITISGDDIANLAGKYLVAEFTSGSGTSAKVSVVLIKLSAVSTTNTVSYQSSGTKVEVWLTDGMPNLAAENTGVNVYAHVGTN